MNRKEYFRRLVNLFEADRADVGNPGAQAQSFAADSGQGVGGNAGDQTAQQFQSQPGAPQQAGSGAEPGSQLGDADYLSAGGQGVPAMPQSGEPIEVSEAKKKAKLFELLKDLLNYGNVFVESLTSIDMNLLDMDQIDKVKKNTDQVDDVIGKIRTYVVDTFPTERYEKALYVYILLRTELLTIVKLLRETLGLNAQPENETTAEASENAQKTQK